MTLQKAIDHVHVVVTSSHLPGWKENREAWAVIRSRIADITSTQQFVKLLDQLADHWSETEGETSPFVDQLRSQVAEFVTTVPTARVAHLSQPQPVAQGEAVGTLLEDLKFVRDDLQHVVDGERPRWNKHEMQDNVRIIDKFIAAKAYIRDWCPDEVRDYVQELATPTIPTGHRVVPVEWTPAMRDAWNAACNHNDGGAKSWFVAKAYRAMLAAAPDAGGV